MKHATPETLAAIEPLLVNVRAQGGLVERKPGTFYRRGSAFLHFHEDPSGLFADVNLEGKTFTRLAVGSAQEKRALLKAIEGALKPHA